MTKRLLIPVTALFSVLASAQPVQLIIRPHQGPYLQRAGETPTGGVTGTTAAFNSATLGGTNGVFWVDGNTYTTVQNAITAAGTTGTVVIPSEHPITDPYTNPNNIVIVDLRTGSGSSPFKNRTFLTPQINAILYDSSPETSNSSAQADPFATPYEKITTQDTSNNDAVPGYWAHYCNYTGGQSPTSGKVGPCIGQILYAGNTTADTHYGVWGANIIAQQKSSNITSLMFGVELNQFNLTGNDSNITSVGTFSAGPYWGYVATADGNAKQVAAFVVSDGSGSPSNIGSGWHTGLFVVRAADQGVLCGVPNSSATAVPLCITHSAQGRATSSTNYQSIPDMQIANAWHSGGSAITRSFTSALVPAAGSDPLTCEKFTFDTVNQWYTCSNGETVSPGVEIDQGGVIAGSTGVPGSSLEVVNGVRSDAGLQHLGGSVGCTTAASVGATCTSSAQDWIVPFADTGYQINCNLITPATGVPVISTLSKSTSTFTITIVAMTAAAATASYDCIGMH